MPAKEADMENKMIRIELTEEDLAQINGGVGVVKRVDTSIGPVLFNVSAAGGKNEPGNNNTILAPNPAASVRR